MQVPALFVRVFSLILAMLAIYFVSAAVNFVASGAILSWALGVIVALLGLLWKLLSAFGGNILILIGIVIVISACLPRKR